MEDEALHEMVEPNSNIYILSIGLGPLQSTINQHCHALDLETDTVQMSFMNCLMTRFNDELTIAKNRQQIVEMPAFNWGLKMDLFSHS